MQSEKVIAASYLKNSKARSRKEPTFVRYAAREILHLIEQDIEMTFNMIADNSRRFFDL